MCPHLDIPLQIKKKNYKTLYKKVVNAYPHHRVLVHYKHHVMIIVNAYPHHRVLVHYKHRQALVRD
jgi:hypothetical protein